MNHKFSVLIIEDEKNILDFVTKTLTTHNYKAIPATTGKEALSLVASLCPDIILLDLGLPDMEGCEIIKQVRTWSSNPIIVVSARAQEEDKVRALDLGADDYLAKPFGMAAQSSELFLMGLFSVLDAILDKDMEEALKLVKVSKNISDALVSKSGVFGPVYEFIVNYEKASWQEVSRQMILLDINMNDLYDAYLQTLVWYRKLTLGK